jgi:hypothetical protein
LPAFAGKKAKQEFRAKIWVMTREGYETPAICTPEELGAEQ